MPIRTSLVMSLLMCLVLCLSVHAGGKLESGPKKGEFVPQPFHPLNINGEHGQYEEVGIKYKGRYHSLICEYGLRPVVVVFVREDSTEMDVQPTKLLLKIEETIKEDPNTALRGFVVYLSPGARTSVTEESLDEAARTKNPAQLNQQAMLFDKLITRLEKRATQFKNIIVTTYPLEGPPGFQLSDKAEVTVVLYKAHRVQETFAFAPGELTDEEVTRVVNGVRGMVGLKVEPKAAE